MARIRSLHPGQWNDDDFLECSPLARLLALGLRNLADDRGVFEWKPTTVKRAILPADNCDIEALLGELAVPKLDGHGEGHGRIVEPFLLGGRVFGVIRNFGKYQRPQKPSVSYPFPKELLEYSSLPAALCSIRGIEPPQGGAIIGMKALERGAIRGIGSLMKEEGGRRKEEGGNSVPSVRAQDAPQRPPSGDDKTWLFNEGLDMLAELTAKPPARIRALVGKWLKQLADDPARLRAVFEEAAKLQPVDPVSWLTAAVTSRAVVSPPKGQPQGVERSDQWWALCMKGWRGPSKLWDYADGPNPDQPGCRVPQEIRDAFPPKAENS